MLIDIYQKLGLNGFAQTDLDQRVHRNQETIALGRMAFGVLRTFMSRLSREQKVQFQEALPSIMRQYEVGDGGYRQLQYEIEEFERKPMLEVEAYREKFHREGQTV
jgi:glucosyl-3-phosphoglycerate synthase